ncbi:hypothetical protein V6N11_055429 [Hibiscus sabdariffa]|uniref:Uncharacterized protein n=1 Tax=Hibiscus sabdariffa TaxID=183260 RepID=A0ABR2PF93_9ROSI
MSLHYKLQTLKKEKLQNSSIKSCISKCQWSEALLLLKKRSENPEVYSPQEDTSSVNSDLRRGSSLEGEIEANAHREIELPVTGEPELPMVGEPEMLVAAESKLPMDDTVDEAELLSNNQSQQVVALPSSESGRKI